MSEIARERMYVLRPEDSEQIALQVSELATQYGSHKDSLLIKDLPVLAAELPKDLRRFIRAFAFEDRLPFCLIHGSQIDDSSIGSTPVEWPGCNEPRPELRYEILLLLYAALLGEPFGWHGEQDGAIVQDVFPIKENEHKQLGSGSRQLLTLHTEGAFHPLRADYLVLLCLRNPTRVATMVSELHVEDLNQVQLDMLFEKRFTIQTPDLYEESSSERIAILFGDRTDPYLRIDPFFMKVEKEDSVARSAFDAVAESLERRVEHLALQPGDLLCINNHRMVHGREQFVAAHDGSDRWLKRVNVTCDIRKSRDRRTAATARLITITKAVNAMPDTPE